MSRIKVLVADDHWIARAAIINLLPSLADEVVTIEASNGQEACDCVAVDPDIDLIVLDLNMPGADPWSTLTTLRKEAPNAPLVVMTVSENRSDVLRSLQSGASGYVPKTALPETILSTFQRVLAGEVALPQRLLVNEENTSEHVLADDSQLVAVGTAFEQFTPRQREIFRLLADGLTNKELASTLGLSVNTIRVHLQAISSKLRVRNRSEVILCASRWKTRAAA